MTIHIEMIKTLIQKLEQCEEEGKEVLLSFAAVIMQQGGEVAISEQELEALDGKFVQHRHRRSDGLRLYRVVKGTP